MPDYTPDTAAAAIVRVCRERFHLTVTTGRHGDTLYAQLQMPGFLRRLAAEGNLATVDSDRIGDLLMTTTQMSLSTHPPITFYLLQITDPDAPGIELRYVTYLDDIRRLYASALGEVEFFDRRIQELKLRPDELAMSDPWIERGVTLGEFLAVQLALRIKAKGLQDAALAAWGLQDCVGWFHQGVLSLTVVREPATEDAADAAWPQPVLTLIAQVLTEYQFTDYHHVLLSDTATMQTQELTRAQIEGYVISR